MFEFDNIEENLISFIEEIPIELNEEKVFNNINSYFKLSYLKKSDKERELLYIFYQKQNEKNINIVINSNTNYEANEKEGTIYFFIYESQEINILFDGLDNLEGNFKIVSSEYEFTIDANKNIYFPEILFGQKSCPSNPRFNITNIDKDYYLKYFYPIDSVHFEYSISYSKNGGDFTEINSIFFTILKSDKITFILHCNSNNKGYYFDKINIINMDKKYISILNYGNFTLDSSPLRILLIDYYKTPYFQINEDKYNYYYISSLTEEQYNNFPLDIQNFGVKYTINITYQKPVNYYYGIIILEKKNDNSTIIISEKEKPIFQLNINSLSNIDSLYCFYTFNYKKSNNNKELFLFIYEIFEKGSSFKIKFTGQNNFNYTELIDNKERLGSVHFPFNESGTFNISFDSKEKLDGSFKIVTTEKEFDMDINKLIKLNEIKFKIFNQVR